MSKSKKKKSKLRGGGEGGGSSEALPQSADEFAQYVKIMKLSSL